MVLIGIDKFEIFSQKLNTILEELDSFCISIESEKISSNEQEDSEIDDIIEKIKKIKTSKEDEGKATKEKTIAFLYQHAIRFIPTDKIKGDFPISDKIFIKCDSYCKKQKNYSSFPRDWKDYRIRT